MKKLFLLVTCLTLVFGWARTSGADIIQFDPDGTSGATTINVDDFDWLPGNSLLMEDYATVGGVTDLSAPNLQTVGGQTFQTATVLFQANLNTMTLGGVTQFNNCGGPPAGGPAGDCFTVVAAVDVLLLQIPDATSPSGFSSTGQFFLVPDSGVFRIYADSTRADDLSGTGFTDGTLVLSGTSQFGFGSVITIPGSESYPASVSPLSGDCENTNAEPTFVQCLDQTAPTNNYLNYYTLLASGGGNFTVDFLAATDYINTAYFLNLDPSIAVAFTGTSSNLPFRDVDPSANFSSNAIANGDVDAAGTLAICGPGADNLFGTGDDEAGTALSPCVNGHGINIQAQTDSHTSFTGLIASEVPEPATLTLLGFGLLGSAAARRRQLRNKR